jgi:hypothetical protein
MTRDATQERKPKAARQQSHPPEVDSKLETASQSYRVNRLSDPDDQIR